MAKLNLNKINDIEEYSDNTQVRGLRKRAFINNNNEEVRIDKGSNFVAKRTDKDHAISLRQHERKKYTKQQEKLQAQLDEEILQEDEDEFEL